MKTVWHASRELGLSIRRADAARAVRSTLPLQMTEWSSLTRQINEVFAAYGGTSGQLLVLSDSLQRVGASSEIAGTLEGRQFLAAATQVHRGSVGLIEWIRSRIPGYPRLLVPHIDAVGLFADQNTIPGHRVPWIPKLRGTGIQLSVKPVRVQAPFGAGAPEVMGDQLLQLAVALQDSHAWNRFRIAKSQLSSSALDNLKLARSHFWERASDEVVSREAGTRLMRRIQYLKLVLNNIRAELSSEAREYWEAFESVDSLLEQVWRVVAHIALRQDVLRIGEYSGLKWSPASQELKVSLEGDPFSFVPGSLVALPPSTFPEGICAIIDAVTMTFGQRSVALELTLTALPSSWPILSEL